MQTDPFRHAIARALHASAVPHVWTTDGNFEKIEPAAIVLTLGDASPDGARTLLRLPSPSEGGRTSMSIVHPVTEEEGVSPATWMWIGQWVRTIQKVRRREAALLAAGHDPADAPQWSLCAHPALRAMLEMKGGRAIRDLSRLDWNKTSFGFEARSDGCELVRCADMLWAKRIEHRTSQWNDKGVVEAMVDNPATPWEMQIQVLVEDVLPETVMAAARGMDLADVIALGETPMRGILIETMAQTPCGDENQIDIGLAPALEPIADPPAGVARDWLTRINDLQMEKRL